MDSTEYHRQLTAARDDRDAAIAPARKAERKALAATRCGCRYPAECRCADRPVERALYGVAYLALRAVEDEAERNYQARLLDLAGQLEVSP